MRVNKVPFEVIQNHEEILDFGKTFAKILNVKVFGWAFNELARIEADLDFEFAFEKKLVFEDSIHLRITMLSLQYSFTWKDVLVEIAFVYHFTLLIIQLSLPMHYEKVLDLSFVGFH